jgi:iron complex outermembrane receptor protein
MITETLRGRPTEVGKELPQKPRQRLHARLSAGGDPVQLHADAQWVSRRWVDLSNTASVPGAFTLDAGGSVRLLRDPEVHLSLEVRNALDDRTVQDGFMNPLPGRALFVTVRAGATTGNQ